MSHADKHRKILLHRRRQAGCGIINNILNSNWLPELHLRGFSGKYNFVGPGTDLNKRLNYINEQPRAHSVPINELDRLAYRHDLDYNDPSLEARHKADDKMIEGMNRIIKNPKTNWRERFDTYLTRAVIKTKRKLGLGKRRRKRIS